MRLENTDTIRPLKDLVVVDVHVQDEKENGIYFGENSDEFHVKVLMGKVVNFGPNAADDLHCPGLEIGDIALFTEFAGYHLSTNNNKFNKAIRGYDIMAMTTNLKKQNERTLTPTADRVLIKVLEEGTNESGLYLEGQDLTDPRLVDISYGEILKKGPTVGEEFQIGDMVAYDPYSGEALRKKGTLKESELRAIREDDILFVNK